MAEVFLSHSLKDGEAACQLCRDLKQAGIEVWLDEWEISAGRPIPTAVENAIDEADFLLDIDRL